MITSSAEPGQGRWSRFWGLPAAERRQLLEALFWLPVTHWRLRRSGLQACLRGLGARPAEAGRLPPGDAARVEQARRALRAVARAARHGPQPGTCLSRALTLLRLLARQGVPARLRVGVRLDGGALDAHAWVEVAGIPLEPQDSRYAAFPGFDTGPRQP